MDSITEEQLFKLKNMVRRYLDDTEDYEGKPDYERIIKEYLLELSKNGGV